MEQITNPSVKVSNKNLLTWKKLEILISIKQQTN